MKPEKKWQKTDPSLRSHPAFHDLVAELDSTPILVDGLLSGLWRMAFTDAPDGDISRFKHRALARAVGWSGNGDVMVTSLLDTGFLCYEGDRLFIHDWIDWGGALFAERADNARRVARHREKPAQGDSVTVTSPLHTHYPRAEIKTKTKKEQDQELLSDSAESNDIESTPPDDFDLFWTPYPRKESKQVARRAWKRVPKKVRAAAAAAAESMRDCVDRGWQEKTFCPHPSTFLNQRRWEDWADGPPANYLPEQRTTGNLTDVLDAGAQAFGLIGDEHDQIGTAEDDGTEGTPTGSQDARRRLPACELAAGQ